MTHNRPCAATGLVSYRYKGSFGFIMIGASDQQDAMNEANRSLTGARAIIDNLEIWNQTVQKYESAK